MPIEMAQVLEKGHQDNPLLLWTPKLETIKDSQMEAFRISINVKYNLRLDSYQELYRWSVENIGNFWAQVWEFCGIVHSKYYEKVVDEEATIDSIPEWFHGSRLNFGENLLRYRDGHVAIIYDSEYGHDASQLTYEELFCLTAKISTALKDRGIVKGDVVGAFAGNVPEVVAFMLAAASIGAIFTTVPPDFGPIAVKERLIQTRPKVLLASQAVYYNGKLHDQLEKLIELKNDIDSLDFLIILNRIQNEGGESRLGRGGSFLYPKEFIEFTNFIAPFEKVTELSFEQLPFNHPMYVLYSSGTTGKPKCLVHSAGGTLIQHLKEHKLHGDLGRDDVILQYTTIGWMMWHWLVSILAIGSTIVLYDGSPFRPSQNHLWNLIEKYKVTRFGTSAKYIQQLQENNVDISNFNIDRLKTIYSTGSPLSATSFRFVYEKVKGDLQLASITGGTDIISLFAGGCPLLPVHEGEIQCATLGMAICSFTESGTVTERGVAGDLVCTRAFPSMPVAFWNDPDGKIYHSAYFNRFEHVWHHGDFVYLNGNTGGVQMLGRSDATLNPAGVRFGSAELYNILTKFPKVIDSLVVGVQSPGENDEKVIMFLETSNGELEEELVNCIKVEIRQMLSPRHVPASILPVPSIPYTLNGKKVEVAVKRILSGQSEVAVTGLANPEALEYFRQLFKNNPSGNFHLATRSSLIDK